MDVATRQVDVAVVGGGLAGLTAAATAARNGSTVVVFDSHALGGRARVDDRNGFIFNRGPRALYLGGEANTILEDLGVPAPGGRPPVKGAMGLRGGELSLLPGDPISLLRTRMVGLRSKVKMGSLLGRLPKMDPAPLAGVSVNDWLETTGLAPEAADIVRMLVRLSSYVNAPDVLSAGAAVRQIQLALGEGVRYLDGGWQTLVDGLADVARAAGAEVRPGAEVRSVRPLDPADDGTNDLSAGRWQVDAGDGVVSAGAVIVAAGSPAACAALIGHRPDSWDRLGPEAGTACLELGLRHPAPPRIVLGIDQPVYCNPHCPPARVAPEGCGMVHVLRYQPHDSATSAEEDRAELQQVARIAGIPDTDIVEERFLRRMVVMGGIPTAASGGLPGRPPVAVEGRPGLFVAGDWVGPRGMLADAAMASGAAAAQAAARTEMVGAM